MQRVVYNGMDALLEKKTRIRTSRLSMHKGLRAKSVKQKLKMNSCVPRHGVNSGYGASEGNYVGTVKCCQLGVDIGWLHVLPPYPRRKGARTHGGGGRINGRGVVGGGGDGDGAWR
jgi:hypothetical protein